MMMMMMMMMTTTMKLLLFSSSFYSSKADSISPRFKTCVFSCSLVGIACSYPAAGAVRFFCCVCVVRQRSLRRADHWSRDFLRSVGCPKCMIPKPCKARTSLRLVSKATEKNSNKPERIQRIFAPLYFIVFTISHIIITIFITDILIYTFYFKSHSISP